MFPWGRKHTVRLISYPEKKFEFLKNLRNLDPNHDPRSQKVKKLFLRCILPINYVLSRWFFSINIFASPFFELPIGVKKIVFTTQIVFIILGTLTPL